MSQIIAPPRQPQPEGLTGSTTCIVISHYEKPLDWLKKWPQHGFSCCKVYTKSARRIPGAVHLPNKGREATSYLRFIIDHYHCLPEYSVLLHDEEFSWHHSGSLIDIVMSCQGLHLTQLNLNHFRLGSILDRPDFAQIADWFHQYLSPYLGPIEAYGDWTLQKLGCAQYILKATVIRARPLIMYQNLYDWLMTTQTPCEISGRLMEWSWPIIWPRQPYGYKSQTLARV